MNKNDLYQMIPKVDSLLQTDQLQELLAKYPQAMVVQIIQDQCDLIRKQIKNEATKQTVITMISNLPDTVFRAAKSLTSPNLKKVINATGTILHTNLGRAPLAKKQVEAINEVISGYSNLEFNLQTGIRGERYSHFEQLICQLTGCEAAMAVNNNAAAVLLTLSALASDKEAIISRGELVEIGGKFRIPDVMKQSNTHLVEVGTTNKTYLSDYQESITEDTALLLKVHSSNYQVVGFVAKPTKSELVAMAHQNDLLVVEDLGSGVLVDLANYGLSHEPTVQESIAAGIDVVTFSGDKLLGGPQAGIIIGKKKYIDQIKKHPLTRALRIDKFTVAMLEQVILAYLDEAKASQELPVLKMLSASKQTLEDRAKKLLALLQPSDLVTYQLVDCESTVGGGSLPLSKLPSVGVTITLKNITVNEFAEKLRLAHRPIIGRIKDDSILLDMRTIFDNDLEMISNIINTLVV